MRFCEKTKCNGSAMVICQSCARDLCVNENVIIRIEGRGNVCLDCLLTERHVCEVHAVGHGVAITLNGTWVKVFKANRTMQQRVKDWIFDHGWWVTDVTARSFPWLSGFVKLDRVCKECGRLSADRMGLCIKCQEEKDRKEARMRGDRYID